MASLHRLVLRTRQVPGLRGIYKKIYSGACAASAGALGALPGVAGVYLHRGLSREGWEPGVSDIDLILVREDGQGREAEFLRGLASRLKSLRRLFPMLGDLWVGSEQELRRYLLWGGLRAREDAPDWKLVSGRGVAVPATGESLLKRRWLDPWVWAFVNQMEISRRFFGAPTELPEKTDSDLRKLYIDARRYSDFIAGEAGADALPQSRAEVKARLPEAARMTAREIWLDSALRLARASTRVLDRVAGPERAAVAFGASADAAQKARLRNFLSVSKFARSAVIDDPYHSYLLLDEGASSAQYEAIADELSKTRRPGVSLALEPQTWALALQSAYLGAPLGWLDGGAGRGSVEGEAVFGGWKACALGAPLNDVPLLSEALRRETAAEAASWMALWWRYLWISPGWTNRFVLHHLYTRALGLSLVLGGAPSGPFCDWELLIARAAGRFPKSSRSLTKLRAALLAQTPASLDSCDRAELSPAHLATLVGLMEGLQELLSPVIDASSGEC